jgi:hypothetical protein
LVDNHGEVAHEWSLPYRVGRYARLLPNGNLAVGMKDPDAPAPFQFVSTESKPGATAELTTSSLNTAVEYIWSWTRMAILSMNGVTL